MRTYIRIFLSLTVILCWTIGVICQEVILAANQSDNITYNNDSQGREQGFIYNLDLAKVRSSLRQAPQYRSDMAEDWTPLAIFLPGGEKVMLEVAESPISETELYELFPQNKTYKVKGHGYQGRIAISDLGVAGMIFKDGASFFIEHLDNGNHVSYYPDPSNFDKFSCDAMEFADQIPQRGQSTYRSANSNGDQLRTFKIALATTGEFYQARGNNNTAVNADINEKLTALNALYEKEFAFTFVLIANNNNLLFTNPNTDGLDPTNSSTRVNSANNVISTTVGATAYDIGHVLHDYPVNNGWSSSGVAYLGVVCGSLKAGAWTGGGGNYPLDFFMGTFAHEVGHQFGAHHNFYGTSANCQNRSPGHGYEPGSGNSIMSYEGSCFANGSCATTQNITPYTNTVYFNAHSIELILNYVETFATCHSTTPSGNAVPVVSVPSSYTIPKGTPFVLEGSATDGNGDQIVFNWEQYDTDNLSLSCPDGHPNDAAFSTTAPLFRSYDPTTSGNIRYFPKLSDIVNNVQSLGEILPQVARTTHFRMTARDFNPAGGGMACAETTVNIDASSGPFVVTTGNTPTGYNAGQSATITWDVAGTNAAPISCGNVDIYFSFDGGQSFSTLLAGNTPNDGSQTVTIPNNSTENGRIKIVCSDNIFFDINDNNISIISSCSAFGGEIINDNGVSAEPGDPILDLELYAGDIITGHNGSLDSGDPSMLLTVENGNGSGQCTSFGNNPKYEVIEFTVDVPGAYTFSVSGTSFSEVINLYQTSFNSASTCNNWLNSNSYYNNGDGYVYLSGSLTHTLIPGTSYILVTSGFSTSNTLGDYSLSFSNGVGGSVYDIGGFPDAGYDYTYVMVNSSNQIVDIHPESDLSNETMFPSDLYNVKGLTYLGGTNLNPYIGSSLTSLQNAINSGNICAGFSSNAVEVIVAGCTPSTKTVTSDLDNGGTGTLRYLIENGCSGDVIQFNPNLTGKTIVLVSEIALTESITINGLGMHDISISGNGNFCIFNIGQNITLNLDNLSLINGYDPVNGGAFLNNGNVFMENISLENNMEGASPKAFTNNGDIKIKAGRVEIK